MSGSERAARRVDLPLAVLAALLSVPATYALQRLIQQALFPDPNPALVSASLRIAMFWRLTVSAPLALVVGVAVHAAARRDGDKLKLARVLEVALVASCALLVLQAVARP